MNAFAQAPVITATDFEQIRALVQQSTGIRLADGKRHLVASRLWSRLRALQLGSFGEYLDVLRAPGQARELALAIDALTTHETSFFREAQHFPAIVAHARAAKPGRPFRVWSAACSTGEEVWSVAMLLAAQVPSLNYELVGTDVSAPSVESAGRALYAMDRTSTIPPDLLRRFCRKGRDEYEGTFLIDTALRQRARFSVANLCQPQPQLGTFDVVLLRNVLIYFETAERQLLVQNVADRLNAGGLLLNGHAESVTGLCRELEPVAQTIHRKLASSARGAA